MKSRAMPIYNFDLIDSMYTELIYNHDIEYHSHYFWEIAITIKGEYTNHFDTGAIDLDTDTIVIIRPKDAHYITNLKAIYRDIYLSDDKMQRLCAVISPTLYRELYEAPTPPYIKIPHAHIESCEHTARLITEMRIDASPKEIEPLHDLLIIKAIGAYYEARNSAYVEQIPRWLLDMVGKLGSSATYSLLGDSPSLPDLIGETGYSHGHVCREFKKYFNCTPIQYLNRQKMLYSTSLLLNGNLSIAEIAQLLGYSNQSSYIMAFKSIYGVAPNIWRKRKIKSMRKEEE